MTLGSTSDLRGSGLVDLLEARRFVLDAVRPLAARAVPLDIADG